MAKKREKETSEELREDNLPEEVISEEAGPEVLSSEEPAAESDDAPKPEAEQPTPAAAPAAAAPIPAEAPVETVNAPALGSGLGVSIDPDIIAGINDKLAGAIESVGPIIPPTSGAGGVTSPVVGPETDPEPETEGVIDPAVPKPVVGEQPANTAKIFSRDAYDISNTEPDSLQDRLIMQQGIHYLAQSINLQRKAREENDMKNKDDKIMYYGTYSLDWTDIKHREIGKTIPEIAYLNYWAPQRCIMLNIEWLPRLVEDGYILQDLTRGTWNGYINKRNVAKYLKKVDYLLRKGKIRP